MLTRYWKKVLMSKPKIIVIAGTTGVGKSQLSIQIASKFNGEVINSDSMQVYKDLPIITNKHPLNERDGIPHHVMNNVEWNEEYYIHRFEKECIEAIDEIHSRGKIPIVIGGTHYYLQTLFNKRIDSKIRTPTEEELQILNSSDGTLIYNTLLKHDSSIAEKFHPNDSRRVRRMLEIYYTTGEKPSNAYAKQETSLKYDTLFLWVYSDPKELDQRLDNRVDNMLRIGGMAEIRQLYEYYCKNSFTADQCENGVWQVIGFKEFLPWLNKEPNVTLDQCVERMKIRTRQYAKKQVKWIKKMLVPDIDGRIYLLNATDLGQWDIRVASRANIIVNQFIDNQTLTEEYAPLELQKLLTKRSPESSSPKETGDWKHYVCDICRDQNDKELITIGESGWQIHLKSKRHKANLNRGKRKKQYEDWKKKKEVQTSVEKGSPV